MHYLQKGQIHFGSTGMNEEKWVLNMPRYFVKFQELEHM
jgi:hypothetical protein